MTATTNTTPAQGGETPKPDLVSVTIDGIPVAVPKGTLVIRAAEQVGIEIPRFCDHPLLDPVGACRQCLVEIATPTREGNLLPMPKPQPACAITVSEGMQVKTQHSSPVADKAQQGQMEFLLINHPLDCPVCDKGGECPLQNQALSNGRAVSRFEDVKRTYPKPVNISSQVLLDRERCILCQRCTRFSEQIAGDAFINLAERGAMSQVSIYEEQPFESYFSGNTVQICPVGALTGAAYRFRARPFDLVSTPSACEHCASGCALRTDHRRGLVLRRMASDDPAVNLEWNCDKGRWAFQYATLPDRLELPLVRQPDGELKVVGWPEALEVAAAGLRSANAAAVLAGGRVSVEDAYAYGKFARLALGTNDLDFRARPHSGEEVAFLAEHVATTTPRDAGGTGVCYADLSAAKAVLLVGFEPEEESPIVFLRLRAAVRRNKTSVYAVAPYSTRGLRKLRGTLLPTVPGAEADALTDVRVGALGGVGAAAAARLAEGGVILVGERLATSPGGLAAAAELATATGATLAWVPRRAGERGALDAGALGALLPGGRPFADPAARAQVAKVWDVDVDGLPTVSGRDTAGIIAAARSGWVGAVVVGGVDVDDLGLPEARSALSECVRRQPGAARVHRDRRRRRHPAGRRTGREGWHIFELGRSGTPVRGGPHQQRDERPPSPGHARCGAGGVPRDSHAGAGSCPARRAGHLDRRSNSPGARPHSSAGRPRRRNPGHLADPAGQGSDAGRRAVPRRHRPQDGGPGRPGAGRAARRPGRRRGHRDRTGRVGQRSGGRDRRHGRRGGVAADQLARLRGP